MQRKAQCLFEWSTRSPFLPPLCPHSLIGTATQDCLLVTPSGTGVTEGFVDLLLFCSTSIRPWVSSPLSFPMMFEQLKFEKLLFPWGDLPDLLIIPKGEWPVCQHDKDPEIYRSFIVSLNPYQGLKLSTPDEDRGCAVKQDVIKIIYLPAGFWVPIPLI